jgi:hypothetical protein
MGIWFVAILLVHGGSTFKLLVLGLVLLMYGDSFLQFFWTLLRHVELVILMCGGKKSEVFLSFFFWGVLLMCGGGNSITWRPLWLCWCVEATTNKCLKFIFSCGCVDMGKNQQRCVNCWLQEWYDSTQNAHYKETYNFVCNL